MIHRSDPGSNADGPMVAGNRKCNSKMHPTNVFECPLKYKKDEFHGCSHNEDQGVDCAGERDCQNCQSCDQCDGGQPTRIANDQVCGPHQWQGVQPTAKACANVLHSKPECNKLYFIWAYGGDKNCGCLTDTKRDCAIGQGQTAAMATVGIYHTHAIMHKSSGLCLTVTALNQGTEAGKQRPVQAGTSRLVSSCHCQGCAGTKDAPEKMTDTESAVSCAESCDHDRSCNAMLFISEPDSTKCFLYTAPASSFKFESSGDKKFTCYKKGEAGGEGRKENTPTTAPSFMPTEGTEKPTEELTEEPTEEPTKKLTDEPTQSTVRPTIESTEEPTEELINEQQQEEPTAELRKEPEAEVPPSIPPTFFVRSASIAATQQGAGRIKQAAKQQPQASESCAGKVNSGRHEDGFSTWSDENCNVWIDKDKENCKSSNYQQNCALKCCQVQAQAKGTTVDLPSSTTCTIGSNGCCVGTFSCPSDCSSSSTSAFNNVATCSCTGCSSGSNTEPNHGRSSMAPSILRGLNEPEMTVDGSCYDQSTHTVSCNVKCAKTDIPYPPGFVGESGCCHCKASCGVWDQTPECEGKYHDIPVVHNGDTNSRAHMDARHHRQMIEKIVIGVCGAIVGIIGSAVFFYRSYRRARGRRVSLPFENGDGRYRRVNTQDEEMQVITGIVMDASVVSATD